jgi:hypothetical protein
MIRFECPRCQNPNRVGDEEAGQTTACAHCGKDVRVPAAEEERLDEVAEEPAPRRKRKASAVLGPREETFEPRKEILTLLAVVFALMGAAGVVCFLLTVVGVLTGGGVALTMFLTPTGVGGCLWCVYFLTLKVTLHEGGFVHSHRGKRRLVPWDDVRSVTSAITEVYQNGVYTGTNYKYTLALEDGTQLVYTNYRLQKVEKLANAVIGRTSEILLPAAREEYDAGEVVHFGPLGVSREGLHYHDKLLEWRDIRGVRVKEGYVTVRKRGKWLRWCNVAASAIPNLLVFLTLVGEIVGLEDD